MPSTILGMLVPIRIMVFFFLFLKKYTSMQIGEAHLVLYTIGYMVYLHVVKFPTRTIVFLNYASMNVP